VRSGAPCDAAATQRLTRCRERGSFATSHAFHSETTTAPCTRVEPPLADQHAVVNSYGLAFLNARLKPPGHALREQAGDVYGAAYLERNHFNDAEVKYTEVKCDIL
tara:strand:+ start:23 stop:340 length:318 start_codon:yes stop_codon:yes gene_type:complete